MTKILPLAAALLIGAAVLPARANPDFDATCRLLNRDKLGVVLGLAQLETGDFNAAQTLTNGALVTCRANLGPGAPVVFSGASTGEPCKLGPSATPLLTTSDWVEAISADGQATLLCFFHH